MPSPSQLLLGSSTGMLEACDLARLFASTDLPILLLGERGTGKTSFASYIHAISGRTGEFVKENLSALPAELQYGALAGHARGGFTGAHESRKGLVESAHGGTLFLDEIGLAPAGTQRLLLALLDGRSLRRLGEDRRRLLDVRVIFATNADLENMVDQQEFRADLLDRMGYQLIRLPPLRERRDEIEPLVHHFVERESARRTPRHRAVVSSEVLECFHVSPWPGNIRQLENACRFAVVSAGYSPSIEMAHLPPSLGHVPQPFLATGVAPDSGSLRETLAHVNGNKAEAARVLRISRTKLYRLLAAQA